VQKILDERERSAIDLVRAPDARLKVAIVEDDPDVVTLLQMMLTGLDFPCEVQTRSDGFKGLILLGTFRPDVLIADLNMPDMDGFRMLRSIQGSEFAPRKIIVTTALSTSEITERGGVPLEALVLQKPYPLSLLENALRQTYTVSQPL
jgi:DNA-binding response OmpR family regulator